MSQVRKLTVYKAFVNTISSYPLFSGCSGLFLDKILVTYSFQPDLEDLVQHLSIIGTEVFDNFYYSPPESYLGPDPATAKFNRHLKNLADRKRAEETLERRNQELSSLHSIAATIGQSLELKKVLDNTLRTVLDLIGLKSGWILLRDPQNDTLILASHAGLPPKFVREEVEEIPDNCIGFHVIQRKETLIAENIMEYPRLLRALPEGEKMACHACVPLIAQDEVVGVMSVASKDYHFFSP